MDFRRRPTMSIREIKIMQNFDHSNIVTLREVVRSSNVLLCDWGLARLYSNPLWHRALELLFGSALYHTAIDMWAVGCVFDELLKQKPRFPAKNEMDALPK